MIYIEKLSIRKQTRAAGFFRKDERLELEKFFGCPYCGSEISMLLDTSTEQDYIEDCEVCCKPISIHYRIEDNEIANFEAKRSDD